MTQAATRQARERTPPVHATFPHKCHEAIDERAEPETDALVALHVCRETTSDQFRTQHVLAMPPFPA